MDNDICYRACLMLVGLTVDVYAVSKHNSKSEFIAFEDAKILHRISLKTELAEYASSITDLLKVSGYRICVFLDRLAGSELKNIILSKLVLELAIAGADRRMVETFQRMLDEETAA